MSAARGRLVLSVLNGAGFVLVVVVTWLANALPLGGSTTGRLSDQYVNLFVPAGLTFSIWGVIYLLLAVFVVYGLIYSARKARTERTFVERIGVLFLVTCAANAGWIFAWHYRQLILSLACMTALLAALIGIYARLNIGRSTAAPAERYLVHMAMSVYLGWITIVIIANLTAVLVAYGWDWLGVSGQPWAVAMVTVAAGLALIMLLRRQDVFYALVADWAVAGILIKRTADSSASAPGVVAASTAGVFLLTAAVAVQVARRKVYR